jgi:RNA polymerase sigma factor (sigma-70 family)
MPENESEREATFEAVVNESARMVLTLALRITGDPNVAQDVSQDVFASVWSMFHRGGSPASWPAYLRTVTIRHALVQLKKRSRSSDERLDDVVDRAHPQPEESAELRELQRFVRDSLARLPKKQAMSFALVKLDGLSYRECAEVVGCSQDAARVHAHRAMLAVARMLGSYAPRKRTKAFGTGPGGVK